MIRTFRNKELANLWAGTQSKIARPFRKRLLTRLDVLNDAANIEELSLPGYNFHALKGFDPTRYTIHVNGPWCVPSNSRTAKRSGWISSNITDPSRPSR